MKYAFLSILLIAGLSGCEQGSGPGTASTPVVNDVDSDSDARGDVARDNSAVNVRDRYDDVKTPTDQNENQRDIDITAKIRQRVVATEMSVNAQNVKIITQDGKVTLRGPVKSEEENAQIEKMAQEVAGAANVDNQLEVQL